jgi:two-component system sensor histidine kinase YesM
MQESGFIQVKEEKEYLEAYLNIQGYKYSNKFTFNFSISEEINSYFMPKLLLQPFVENANVHGIAGKNGHGVILIKGYLENENIKFRIEDNGVGINQEKIANLLNNEIPVTGVGVRNVLSRLKTTFGEDYPVSLWSEANLYTIIEVVYNGLRKLDSKKGVS